MEQMIEKQGVTEELKAQDQMKWVRLMNNIKASAEEIILKTWYMCEIVLLHFCIYQNSTLESTMVK